MVDPPFVLIDGEFEKGLQGGQVGIDGGGSNGPEGTAPGHGALEPMGKVLPDDLGCDLMERLLATEGQPEAGGEALEGA